MNLLQKLLCSKEFTGLCDDSRRVKKGNIFFSFKSDKQEVYALAAKEAKALAVVGEGIAPQGLENIWVSVDSVKESRVFCAKEVFKNPFEKLKVHAVTGTNGKTTTAFLMREILVHAGRSVALLGTVCNKINDKSVKATLTTPGLLDFYAFAKEAVDEGVTDLVMETSSHALFQGRMEGVQMTSALFSNLTQDHLDYHKNMENYFLAKKILFDKYLSHSGVAVINIDDAYGKRLASENYPNQILVSSKENPEATICPSVSSKVSANGIELLIEKISKESFKTPLCGEFNVDNVMLVISWAYALGIKESAIRSALHVVRVPGRFEKVWSENSKHVVVDYAHTPDALKRVLETARSLCENKLLVVFGCGGDRDALKRPLMGAIAEQLADEVFVTSDNPRTENPKDIIQDVVQGMKGKFLIEENRALAIEKAVVSMNSEDWLVVAGKGHENYQILGTEKFHFDDSEEVRRAMNLCKN